MAQVAGRDRNVTRCVHAARMRRHPVRAHAVRTSVAGVVAVAAVLAGCAGESPQSGPGGAPSSTSAAGASPSGTYHCMGTPIPYEALADPRPATELGADATAALAGHEVPDLDLAEWTIATESTDAVVLLRALPEPEDGGGGDVRTHERLEIGLVDAANLPESPAWMLTALGTCAISAAVPGAGTATITLDPAKPPEPTSADVALLVTEMACASGQDATGRVEVAALRETDTAVEVVVTVRPPTGDQACPANPPTPFTITLDEPLGDRTLHDASVVPARTIALPDG